MLVDILLIPSVHCPLMFPGINRDAHGTHIGGRTLQSVHLYAVVPVIPLFPKFTQEQDLALSVQTVQVQQIKVIVDAARGMSDHLIRVNALDHDLLKRCLPAVVNLPDVQPRLARGDLFPRDPSQQRLVQRSPVQRLGDKILKTVFQKSLPDTLHGVCGQRDDHRHPTVFPALTADDLHCLDPVHLRHHVIHKYDVIARLANERDRCRPAFRLVDLQAVGLHEDPRDLPVDRVVVHHQHLAVLGDKRLELLLPPDIHRRDLRHWSVIHDLLRDRYCKRRPFPVYALHLDRALHQLHEALCDRKPQSGPLHGAVSL